MESVEQRREAYVEEKLAKDPLRNLNTARKRWIFGLFGVHKFYLNRLGSGLFVLTLTMCVLFTSLWVYGVVAFGVGVIWWIVDFFRLPKLVEEANVAHIAYYREEAERRIH